MVQQVAPVVQFVHMQKVSKKYVHTADSTRRRELAYDTAVLEQPSGADSMPSASNVELPERQTHPAALRRGNWCRAAAFESWYSSSIARGGCARRKRGFGRRLEADEHA
jgi:hypothetical protein